MTDLASFSCNIHSEIRTKDKAVEYRLKEIKTSHKNHCVKADCISSKGQEIMSLFRLKPVFLV